MTPLPQAWLEMADGRMLWLDKGVSTLGRGASNTHVLDLPGISRSHAMVQPGPGGGHLLADLRSTNGTYHNGLRLEQTVRLRDGDKIELGDVVLVYRCQQGSGGSADAGATSVMIHSGKCWLLMLDIIGFTSHTQKVGAEAATEDFKKWLEQVRPILVRAGCTINAYLGDAVFAYWRHDKHPYAKVATAMRELVALQPSSPRPFRILLHFGNVRISGGLQGENLAGSDVIYLFRIEKSTKPLGSTCVLSEAAAESLALTETARNLGRHAVTDYEGTHGFYSLEA
ncbi:FHA domain-containing protein [Oleiharenicola lentus]|uniref:FHA domain-containing protein n=1 Tax=Oleiharenicola lentus TaxID=2508720 RepID=A0A4Q1C4T2_9BACT|nr:FHA domain-containing protein [Oleiharenicola lentus]RXK53422.1 FHA domain-containing protein [Oleiharenicola lentus]